MPILILGPCFSCVAEGWLSQINNWDGNIVWLSLCCFLATQLWLPGPITCPTVLQVVCCLQPLCLESYRRSQPVAGRRSPLVGGRVGKGALKVTQACSFIITTNCYDDSLLLQSLPSTRWDPFQHRVRPGGLNPGGTGRESDASTKLGCQQVPRVCSRGMKRSFSCKTL